MGGLFETIVGLGIIGAAAAYLLTQTSGDRIAFNFQFPGLVLNDLPSQKR